MGELQVGGVLRGQVGAGECLDDYPEGVFFVELAPLGDPALLPQAVATALDVAEEVRKPLLESLEEVVRGRHQLLGGDFA